MPYTKAELIDQVYLKASGGKTSPDVDLFREDIPKFLSAAVSYAIVEEYRMRRRESIEERRITGMGGIDDSVNSSFVTRFALNIETDANNKSFVTLPVTPVDLPKNRGLYDVLPVSGKAGWTQIESPVELIGGEMFTQDQTFFYYDRVYGGPTTVTFVNLPSSVDSVHAYVVVSLDDLQDNDIIPIPSGQEVRIIDLCVQFFTGQRQIPADLMPNTIDR